MNITIEGVTLGSIGTIPVMVYVLLKYPEKVQKWVAILLGLFHFLWKGKKSLEMKFVTLDTEGRVNDFLNEKIIKNLGDFLVKKIKICWLNEDQINFTREDFLKSGELVIQLHRSENQDQNFLNAALLMISRCVVPNRRGYLSKHQKAAVDLYSAYKFFETEKPKIKSTFHDKFIVECQKKPDVTDLIKKFIEIDEEKLFFPILIQELQLLVQKVILIKNNQDIYAEIKGFIDFLLDYVRNRKEDKEGALDYSGTFSKFAILIVGKTSKMKREGIAPYVNRINKHQEHGVETIYIISKADSEVKDFVSDVYIAVRKAWLTRNEFTYSTVAKTLEGKPYKRKNNLLVLRRKGIEENVQTMPMFSSPELERSPAGLTLRQETVSTKENTIKQQ